MKRLLIFSILCLVGTVSMKAQETGQTWMGGGINFHVTSTDGHTNTSVGISPEIGYKFADKWAIGTEISYTHRKQYYESYGDESYNNFRIAPFLRSYIVQKEWGSFFLDGSVHYSYSDFADGVHTFGLGLQPGVAIHLSERISFISKLGWLGYSYSSFDDINTHSAGLDLNLSQVTFGINIHF
ncbi:MAG: porin family protein [Tannerellaceae bacterium]|nr:porin family protein [Tannerellaceae bacterium]